MRISDWSSDVCSSDLADQHARLVAPDGVGGVAAAPQVALVDHVVVQQRGGVDEFDAGGHPDVPLAAVAAQPGGRQGQHRPQPLATEGQDVAGELRNQGDRALRSEEHTSERQSLMGISYAVYCLKI